jgi:hypothetical protein
MDQIMKILKTITFLLFVLLSFSAFANKVESVDYVRTSEVNQIHLLKLKFTNDPNSINCGLSIDWGDGQIQGVRVGKDLDLKPPFHIDHVYKTSGSKSFIIKGELIFRGFGSVGACEVDAKGDVTIVDSAMIEMQKAKLLAEQRVRELEEQLKRKDLPQNVASGANVKSEVQEQIRTPTEGQSQEIKVSQAAEMAAKADAEEKDRLWKQSPEYKKQQQEIAKARITEERVSAEKAKKDQAEAIALAKETEKRRLVEEREKIAREKKEQAEAAAFAKESERKRLIEERLAAEKLKKEQAEASKREIIEAKDRLEQDKRRRIEEALFRPLVNKQDPRLSCQSSWELDARFTVLATKISLTGLTDLTFPMLSNQAMPSAKEQQSIAALADEFKRCVTQSAQYRSSNYSKEVNSLLEREDAAFLDAAIDLYAKKINYGNYNYRVQKIAKESKTSLTQLEQKISSDSAASAADAKTRAAALRDAQIRQDQQQQAQQYREQQARQAEEARVDGVRRQWAARCQFEQKNATERYQKSKENDCRTNSKGLAFLCAVSVVAAADDYGKSAFSSCMSGAP